MKIIDTYTSYQYIPELKVKFRKIENEKWWNNLETKIDKIRVAFLEILKTQSILLPIYQLVCFLLFLGFKLDAKNKNMINILGREIKHKNLVFIITLKRKPIYFIIYLVIFLCLIFK